MTVTEYIQRLDTFRKNLPQRIFTKVTDYAGATIRAQVENRVEQTQKNAKNYFFSVYSPNYLKYRAKKGYHNQHKSFELTRRMWTEWGVKEKQVFNDGFLVRMGGMTPYSQDLINKHSDKEGIDIIDMTDQEGEKLAKWVDKWVFEFAKEIGL